MPRAWYSYNGQLPITAAGSWTKVAAPSPGLPRFECNGPTNLCVIYAFYASAPAGTNPTSPLSSNVQNYITTANVTSNNVQPQIGKPYLYKKS